MRVQTCVATDGVACVHDMLIQRTRVRKEMQNAGRERLKSSLDRHTQNCKDNIKTGPKVANWNHLADDAIQGKRQHTSRLFTTQRTSTTCATAIVHDVSCCTSEFVSVAISITAEQQPILVIATHLKVKFGFRTEVMLLTHTSQEVYRC